MEKISIAMKPTKLSISFYLMQLQSNPVCSCLFFMEEVEWVQIFQVQSKPELGKIDPGQTRACMAGFCFVYLCYILTFLFTR